MRARAGWLKAGVLGAGGLQGSPGGAGVESGSSGGVSGAGLAAAHDGGAELSEAAGLGAVVVAQRIHGGTGIEHGRMSTGQRVAGGCGGWVDGSRRGSYLWPGRVLGRQAGKGGVQGSQLAGSRTRSGRGWG